MSYLMKHLINRKNFIPTLFVYTLGLLTVPLLQLALDDVGSVLLAIAPHVIVIAVVLMGVQIIMEQTLQQSQENQLKRQVMRDVLSQNRQVVKDAMTMIVDRNWHLGVQSFLQGLDAESVEWSDLHMNGANLYNAQLFRANLENTWLEHANLREALISMANFQDAKLSYSDMSEGRLMTSDFRGANLHGTICRGTRLAHSNFGGAILMGTDLRGADLTRVNLQGVRFIQYAKFDKDTVLPTAKLISKDGKRNKIVNLRWTPNFDWTPYQTGEVYQGYSDEWKEQMGWVDPASLPTIDEDVQSYLA